MNWPAHEPILVAARGDNVMSLGSQGKIRSRSRRIGIPLAAGHAAVRSNVTP
jgi:hypothetical protein